MTDSAKSLHDLPLRELAAVADFLSNSNSRPELTAANLSTEEGRLIIAGMEARHQLAAELQAVVAERRKEIRHSVASSSEHDGFDDESD